MGIYLISMGGTGEFGINYGDIINLGASVFTACEMIVLDRNLKDMDPIVITIIELGVIAVFSLICIPIFGETFPDNWTGLEIGAMIYLGLGCSAIGFAMKVLGQKHLPANRASLILTLEPVIGGLSSTWLLSENMGFLGWIGAAIVVFSIVLSEYTAHDTEMP